MEENSLGATEASTKIIANLKLRQSGCFPLKAGRRRGCLFTPCMCGIELESAPVKCSQVSEM